jgi:hypothetical protein
MVEAYLGELAAIAEDNRVDVILVARPDTLDDVHLAAQTAQDQAEAATASDSRRTGAAPVVANFHDLLKARALTLGDPAADPAAQHLG